MCADQQHPGGTDAKAAAANPAAPLLDILPRRLVICLAIGALALAVASFGVLFLAPRYGEHPNARFAFCALVAVALSIFFFVMYPQNLRLNFPILGTSVALFGPIVLFFVVLYALDQWMPVAPPAPPGWRRIPISSDQVQMHSRSLIRFSPTESDDQVFLYSDDNGNLDCVFVYFDSDEAIEGKFHVAGEAPYPVSFSPDDRQFSLSRSD